MPDYAARWAELKGRVEYEAEAMRDDAKRAGKRWKSAEDESDYHRSTGEADAMARVLAHMERVDQEQPE